MLAAGSPIFYPLSPPLLPFPLSFPSFSLPLPSRRSLPQSRYIGHTILQFLSQRLIFYVIDMTLTGHFVARSHLLGGGSHKRCGGSAKWGVWSQTRRDPTEFKLLLLFWHVQKTTTLRSTSTARLASATATQTLADIGDQSSTSSSHSVETASSNAHLVSILSTVVPDNHAVYCRRSKNVIINIIINL